MITGNRDEVRYAVEIYVLPQLLAHGRSQKQRGKKLSHFFAFVLRGDKIINSISQRLRAGGIAKLRDTVAWNKKLAT